MEKTQRMDLMVWGRGMKRERKRKKMEGGKRREERE